MSFAGDLDQFRRQAIADAYATFGAVVDATRDSIVDGSPITSAPGQPVASGRLKRSWVVSRRDAEHASILTDAPYAAAIEAGADDRGPLTLESPVGGFGSVAKTVAGYQRLVDHVLQQRGGSV